MKKYINSSSDRSKSTFDIESAKKDGASEDLIKLGNLYNSYASSYADAGPSSNAPAARKFPPAVHGLWCGPGRSGPGEPVDTLDRLCMNHDHCYADKGYFAAPCDWQLTSDIWANIGKMNAGETAVAIVIASYFNS